MKNKLILLILTFLITTPLIAMEEGAGPFRGDERSPASPEALITVILEDDPVNLDKKTLMQSEMIQAAFRFDKDTETISLEDFTKDQFMQAYQLMEYAFYNENEKIQPALTSKDISELLILWQIFDYLDVPPLQKTVQTHLEPILASHIDKNLDAIPDLLSQLPESFKQGKFSDIIMLLPEKLKETLVPKLTTFTYGHRSVHALNFDPKHDLVAVSSRSTVYIYKISDAKEITLLTTLDHIDRITSIAFDLQNNLMATIADTTVNIYKISDSDQITLRASLQSNDSLTSIDFDPKHNLLATGLENGTLNIYNISNLDEIPNPTTLKLPDANTSVAVAFDTNHNLLAARLTNNIVHIYKISGSNEITLFTTLDKERIARGEMATSAPIIDFDPIHNLLATGSTVNIYKIFDPNNIAKIDTLKDRLVKALAFDPTNSLLATASNNLNIYDTSTINNITKLITLEVPDDSITSVAFDPKHNLFATGSFGSATLNIYDFSLINALRKLAKAQGLAVLYLLLTKSEPKDVPKEIQQIISTIDKETWSIIAEHLKPDQKEARNE